MKKICVVTGSRAEYGLLKWVMKGIKHSTTLKLQLIVTGSHLYKKYGYTKDIIKTDIMIDDHFKNLDVFHGKTFLFTQPHNEKSNPGKHERVNNWIEIKNILLG